MEQPDPNPYQAPHEITRASSVLRKPSRIWYRLGLLIIGVGFTVFVAGWFLPTGLGSDLMTVRFVLVFAGAVVCVLGFFWSIVFAVIFAVRTVRYMQSQRIVIASLMRDTAEKIGRETTLNRRDAM